MKIQDFCSLADLGSFYYNFSFIIFIDNFCSVTLSRNKSRPYRILIKKQKEIIMAKRKAIVNVRDCVACGCCIKVCPRDAITVPQGIHAKIDEELCIGCGKCAKECPASVITLEVLKQ